MEYEVIPDRNCPTDWRVEAIDFEGDGDCYVAIFCGKNAEIRAKEYAGWMKSKCRDLTSTNWTAKNAKPSMN